MHLMRVSPNWRGDEVSCGNSNACQMGIRKKSPYFSLRKVGKKPIDLIFRQFHLKTQNDNILLMAEIIPAPPEMYKTLCNHGDQLPTSTFLPSTVGHCCITMFSPSNRTYGEGLHLRDVAPPWEVHCGAFCCSHLGSHQLRSCVCHGGCVDV